MARNTGRGTRLGVTVGPPFRWVKAHGGLFLGCREATTGRLVNRVPWRCRFARRLGRECRHVR